MTKKQKKIVALVLEPDELAKIAHEGENLPDEAAAVAMVKDALGRTAVDRYKAGCALLRMKENAWLCGYSNFEEMAHGEFGLKKSAAYEAIAIYETVLEIGLSASVVREIGVRKLGLLCSRAKQDGWTEDEFSARAETAKLVSYRALLNSLKEPADTDPAPASTPTPSAPASAVMPFTATASATPTATTTDPAVEEKEAPSPEWTDEQKQLHSLMLVMPTGDILEVLEFTCPDLNMTVSGTG